MSRFRHIELVSDDNVFGIFVPEHVVETLVCCCTEAYPSETGGILLGRYSDNRDMALVVKATFPPPDSARGRDWFLRGVAGLQRLINKLWKSNYFYLGEWHYHPDGAPVASRDDVLAIAKIANAPQYHCPEPVLLIIGGGRSKEWEARGYICVKKSSLANLGSVTLSK